MKTSTMFSKNKHKKTNKLIMHIIKYWYIIPIENKLVLYIIYWYTIPKANDFSI